MEHAMLALMWPALLAAVSLAGWAGLFVSQSDDVQYHD
jgi:hypothetical protein